MNTAKIDFLASTQENPVLWPNRDLQAIAKHYIKKNGLSKRGNPYAQIKIPLHVALNIAAGYEKAEHRPRNPDAHKSYTALKGESLNQLRHLQSHGYRFFPYTGSGQPYDHASEIFADLQRKRLQFFPTDSGFGPKDERRPQNHPLMQKTCLTMGKLRLRYNDVFRIVHDVFGHAAEGNDIVATGEFKAFKAHTAMFTNPAIPALYTETVAQSAWTEVGPHRQKGAEISYPR